MNGTKLIFLREILSEDKKALKQNDIVHLEIPNYPEISVKSLYEEALADPEVRMYLPEPKQLSGKLPERKFFFGILSSVRPKFMKDIIEEAHKNRFKPD